MSDEERTEIVMGGAPEPQGDPRDRLLMQAMKTGDVSTLERMIDLRNRDDDRNAKLAFDRHFSEMQAEFTAVERDKTARDGTKDLYAYAPIETLQKALGPIIHRHQFSYRWREETIEGGKRCTLIVAGWGHSEETTFDIPRLQGTAIMNPIQIAGAMSTYGRRYTFIAGFGVIISDEDDDAVGATATDALRLVDEVAKIRAAESIDDLKAVFHEVWGHLAGDDEAGRSILSTEKDKRKVDLLAERDASTI
jgi:hypothetical protein